MNLIHSQDDFDETGEKAQKKASKQLEHDTKLDSCVDEVRKSMKTIMAKSNVDEAKELANVFMEISAANPHAKMLDAVQRSILCAASMKSFVSGQNKMIITVSVGSYCNVTQLPIEDLEKDNNKILV